MVFLSMIILLINMIFFQQTGNWKGYLEDVYEFILWCLLLNWQHYARDLSLFYVDLVNLKNSLSDSYDYLSKGELSTSLPKGLFTKIPIAQMIVMAINISLKEVDKLAAITENKGTKKMDANKPHLFCVKIASWCRDKHDEKHMKRVVSLLKV